MRPVTWRDRLRYAFDNSLARGPLGLMAWLALASALVIGAVGLLVWALNLAPEPVSLGKLLWMGLMRTLDSGTMGGDEGSWPFLLAMLAVTLGGIFIISSLIGTITSGIESKLDELRKGRSRVVESEHTVILGWSEQVFSILTELAEANASRGRASVVILAPEDPVAMQDAIRAQAKDLGRTRVVCRSGSPMVATDLALVGLESARAVIVLSPEGDQPDIAVIKVLLAIGSQQGGWSASICPVVAEIRDERNLRPAQLASGGRAQLVLVGDMVARIVAQTCRQSGLSLVYQELLDFGGDEIYFREEPALVGRAFGDCLAAYPHCAVMGVRPRGGIPTLLPSMDRLLEPGDALILVAEDDSLIRLAEPAASSLDESAITLREPAPARPERTLILGWNWRGGRMLRDLDAYVAAGSSAVVVADEPSASETVAALALELRHITVAHEDADSTDRGVLDRLAVSTFDQVIVLCYGDQLDAQAADARTLITLLHLRDIADTDGRHVPVVSEMLDIRNRNLAEVTQADDFIVSDRLVSLVLTQVSENPELNAVFADIFDPEGAEIYLKPVEDYLRLGRPVSGYTMVEAARRKGEACIGYRLASLANQADRSYGVVINPDKAATVSFGAGDRLVVVAEG
jgi:voltage-gated potassium channel Kch